MGTWRSSFVVGAFGVASSIYGCSSVNSNEEATSGAGGEGGETSTTSNGSGGTSCDGYWDLMPDFFPDVDPATLETCDSEAGDRVASSLFNLAGITISGNGTVDAEGNAATLTPCVQARCDANYAYVASNALPHYDPVAQPIFDTAEKPIIYRIPLSPQAIDQSVTRDDWSSLRGCETALSHAVYDETPTSPPSGRCFYQSEDGTIVSGERHFEADGEVFHKLHCYGQTGLTIGGVPTFSPCEEARPDPYGTPLFNTDGASPFLDKCLGHPAAIVHYHGMNEACFTRDDTGAPLNSYAVGASTWNLEASLNDTCTEPSGIVGWSYDGHPIKGPCVCVTRASDGSCSDVRRARSGYVYAGMRRWTNDQSADPNIHASTVDGSYFANELMSCTTDNECCDGVTGTCRLTCQWLMVEAEGGDPAAEQRCVSPDYTWCTHEFAARDGVDDGFAYLDRCNGIESADGYAYHATGSFPYVIGCYRDTPSETFDITDYIYLDAGTGGMGGPGGGGPPGGG